MIEPKPFFPPQIVAVPKLDIKQVPAHPTNYSRATRTPIWIIVHCTGGHEGLTQDNDAAVEISKELPKGKQRSFHYSCDANSATQSVPDKLTAWHAKHTGNSLGIGIELCGSADQTLEQWYDAISLTTMQIAARLCAELCKTWKLPATLLQPRDLISRLPGITTHHFVSQAFKESDHYDPGPNFPVEAFVDAVKRAM